MSTPSRPLQEPRQSMSTPNSRAQHQNQSKSRGRTRPRGGRGRNHDAAGRARPGPPPVPPDGPGGGGVSGKSPTIGAAIQKGEQLPSSNPEDEADVCFICASPVVHHAVAPCNHRTCHICALRLRALYKTRACAHCRTEAPFVIFADDATRNYADFKTEDIEETDESLGIKYTKKSIREDTDVLLRYNCPEPSCDIACFGWPNLHSHVRKVHHKVLCDLCTRNKKVFTHEHELFTPQELKRHEKFGDDHPGAVDQSGFRGHPECGFCRTRFYGDDELYTHCRDNHERCFICDRRTQGAERQYYVDYNSLEDHFRNEHFPCLDSECLEKKFVVFDSEMDLKAHQLDTHGGKDTRRDARRVDISTFDYRTPHHERRGRGRGRDPQAESIAPSVQPLRRDELAYQRQMAIQSAQSAVARTFGGQLTTPQAPTSAPDIARLQIDNNEPTMELTPQQQARQLHHAAVLDRAAVLLGNDPAKVSSFRDGVSSYRTSKITASQLIDTFFSLFDASSSDLGKLVKELAEIYENETKRSDLLRAWNDWRAINEDYPSLPGATDAHSGAGGHRVLKLKSATAQSSRSAVSKQGSWGHVARAMNTSTSAPSASSRSFPAISSTGSIARVGTTTPWASSLQTNSERPRPAQAQDAFPALPTAAKPSTLISGMNTRGVVRWGDSRHSGTAWGANGISETADVTEVTPELSAGKKKGKQQGKGKQTLYRFG